MQQFAHCSGCVVDDQSTIYGCHLSNFYLNSFRYMVIGGWDNLIWPTRLWSRKSITLTVGTTHVVEHALRVNLSVGVNSPQSEVVSGRGQEVGVVGGWIWDPYHLRGGVWVVERGPVHQLPTVFVQLYYLDLSRRLSVILFLRESGLLCWCSPLWSCL